MKTIDANHKPERTPLRSGRSTRTPADVQANQQVSPEALPSKAGPAEAVAKPKPSRFPKGTSGNPKGRPPGSRNKTTLALQAILEDEAERITRKAIDMAVNGDRVMIKLCLERLLPARKEPAAPFELSAIQGTQDLPGAFAQIFHAVSDGVLSVADARTLAEVLEMHRNAIATAEHEARLEKLEEYAFPR